MSSIPPTRENWDYYSGLLQTYQECFQPDTTEEVDSPLQPPPPPPPPPTSPALRAVIRIEPDTASLGPCFSYVSQDVFHCVFSHLPLFSLGQAPLVCRTWY